MPTLIFTPRHSVDAQALWKAAAAAGWCTERLASWRIPDHLKDVEEPVLYCEALFGPVLAEQLGRRLLDPAEDWLVRLPFEYRQREIALTTLAAARTIAQPRFVKPPNDKSFPAAVYRGADLPSDFDDKMPVLVSDVVTWESEFRCFVLDREVQTFSIYCRNGELQRDAGFISSPEEDDAMLSFLDTLLADPRVDLPRATVVDVGRLAGQRWACVEQNAAWGAGIYGCYPARVLDVLRHASVVL